MEGARPFFFAGSLRRPSGPQPPAAASSQAIASTQPPSSAATQPGAGQSTSTAPSPASTRSVKEPTLHPAVAALFEHKERATKRKVKEEASKSGVALPPGVAALYHDKYQCNRCGLRLKTPQILAQHLQDHEQLKLVRAQMKFRGWHFEVKDWMIYV